MTRLCITRRKDHTVLARADTEKVILLENNYYFPPDTVRRDSLETSDRIYHCPKKGLCFWVDMKMGKTWINDVSWIYENPQSGYEKIGGYYGFFPDHTAYEVGECD